MVTLVELNTVDAVAVTHQFALLLHLEGQRLGRLIIDSNMAIPTGHGQEDSVLTEIKTVEMIIGVLLVLVEAFA